MQIDKIIQHLRTNSKINWGGVLLTIDIDFKCTFEYLHFLAQEVTTAPQYLNEIPHDI